MSTGAVRKCRQLKGLTGLPVLVISLGVRDDTLWKTGSVSPVTPQARVALWELEILCRRPRGTAMCLPSLLVLAASSSTDLSV